MDFSHRRTRFLFRIRSTTSNPRIVNSTAWAKSRIPYFIVSSPVIALCTGSTTFSWTATLCFFEVSLPINDWPKIKASVNITAIQRINLFFSTWPSNLSHRSFDRPLFPLLFTNRRLHYFQTHQKPLYFKAFRRFSIPLSHLVNKPPSVFKLVNKLPAYLLRAYGLLVHYLMICGLCLSTLESVKNPYISRLFGVFPPTQLQHLSDGNDECLFTKLLQCFLAH